MGLSLFLAYETAAQSPSPEAYYQQARTAAFDHKDYPAAIRHCQQALKQSQDNLDIQIF